MQPILTAAQMRACDRYAIKTLHISSLLLMENAANALKKACIDSKKTDRIVILAGTGNNGGDGYCLADLLLKEGIQTQVIPVAGDPKTDDAKHMYKRLNKSCLVDPANALRAINDASTVVDCVFGTGFHGQITDLTAQLFCAANNKFTIACDVPSGIDCDTGAACQNAIRADVTVTFGAYKPYCFLYPAKEHAGIITVADIGLPNEAIAAQMPYIHAVDDSVLSWIKSRPENAHKGLFGSVQLVCGSKKMTGAAVMAAKSALRSGVGLVYMASDKKTRKILQTHLCEPVFVKRGKKTKAAAAVVGCGLGRKAKSVKKYAKRAIPCIFDADALTYLGKKKHINILLRDNETIVTPHPLEMARMTGQSVKEIEADRIHSALSFSKKYATVVVLKGRHTVTALPDGSVYINTTGNSGLSKGGSGDVLAGLIGGLTAQGYSAAEAAILGVYLHGKAADNLINKGMSHACILPTDLPVEIGNLLK